MQQFERENCHKLQRCICSVWYSDMCIRCISHDNFAACACAYGQPSLISRHNAAPLMRLAVVDCTPALTHKAADFGCYRCESG